MHISLGRPSVHRLSRKALQIFLVLSALNDQSAEQLHIRCIQDTFKAARYGAQKQETSCMWTFRRLQWQEAQNCCFINQGCSTYRFFRHVSHTPHILTNTASKVRRMTASQAFSSSRPLSLAPTTRVPTISAPLLPACWTWTLCGQPISCALLPSCCYFVL